MTRSNFDSSDDGKARSRMVGMKGSPFLPPMARYMAGGADPVDPYQPKTDQEIFAKAMSAFKCKFNIKGYEPVKDEANGFTGGVNSGLLCPLRVSILC